MKRNTDENKLTYGDVIEVKWLSANWHKAYFIAFDTRFNRAIFYTRFDWDFRPEDKLYWVSHTRVCESLFFTDVFRIPWSLAWDVQEMEIEWKKYRVLIEEEIDTVSPSDKKE